MVIYDDTVQGRALEHLAEHGVPAPENVRSVHSRDVEFIADSNAQSVMVRVLTFVPGKVMAHVTQDEEFLQARSQFRV